MRSRQNHSQFPAVFLALCTLSSGWLLLLQQLWLQKESCVIDRASPALDFLEMLQVGVTIVYCKRAFFSATQPINTQFDDQHTVSHASLSATQTSL